MDWKEQFAEVLADYILSSEHYEDELKWSKFFTV